MKLTTHLIRKRNDLLNRQVNIKNDVKALQDEYQANELFLSTIKAWEDRLEDEPTSQNSNTDSE